MRGGVNETSAFNLLSDGISNSYTPSTGINSCLENIKYEKFEPGKKYYIELVVTWSGFDTSNTAGSFNMYFQGAQYVNSSEGWCWKYNNPMAGALNSKQNLRDLVLSKTSGSTTLCAEFTIVSTTGLYLGCRSNYSNGKGRLQFSNIKLIPLDHSISYGSGTKTRILENEILSQEIIEF